MKCRLRRISEWERLAKEARFQPGRMAELCSISLRQLERYFTVKFKETPRTWSRRIRCRLALKLIADGWPNKAVVHELHFANESHLCHEFAHHFGKRPQAFSSLFDRDSEIELDDPPAKS